jgi:C-methyltransferase
MDEKHSTDHADAAAGFKIYELLFGLIVSQGIYVAAKLSIADRIAKTPMNADELAAATKTNPQSLRRVLEMLASKGVFTEGEDGRFRNTPMSVTLCSDAQPSMRDVSLMLSAHFVRSAWGELLDAVRTGEPAFQLFVGQSRGRSLTQRRNDFGLLVGRYCRGRSV